MPRSPEQIPAFQQQQLAFTAHIRDPQQPIPAEIEQRRMAVYTELFYNGTEGHLARNFPVLRSLMDAAAWHSMVRDFFVKHRCETALFTQIGLEFIEYLQQERTAQASDWPFMLELAHYEYVELAVQISDADQQPEAQIAYDPNGNLLQAHPVISPTAWNLSYQYPVHQISTGYVPEAAPEQPTHLVVYRDRLDAVHFLEINAVTQRLLTLLQKNQTMTGMQALQQIAQEMQHPQPETIIQAGMQLLSDLRKRNVIWGSCGS